MLGSTADVDWIRSSTTPGLTIQSAVPPVFAAYATILVPDKDLGRAENAERVLEMLAAQSSDSRWWLGYLDTGGDDVVFPTAPRVTLYTGWQYVLVQAGPEQAVRWRQDYWSSRAPGPDIVFPHDRSWMLSWLWNDDWRCFGGPEQLVEILVSDPRLQARRVQPGEDATPPGHVAR